jgi:hypothetical protein
MERDKRLESAEWKGIVENAAYLVMQRSFTRTAKIKLPYKPEYKAYMALALLAYEAIQAFLALDEGMK